MLIRLGTLYSFILLFYTLSLSATEEHINSYESALVAYKNDDFESSFIHLKNVFKDSPHYLPAKILMGKVLLNKKLFSAAEQEFTEAEYRGADINLFVVDWGRALLGAQQFERLISVRFKAPLSEENTYRWQYLKSEACISIQDLVCAKSILNELLLKPSHKLSALNSLSRIALGENDYDEALRLLLEARSLSPENPETLRLFGQYHRLQGDLAQAELMLKKAYDIAPSSIIISRNLADIYIFQDKFDDALALSNKILNQYPQDPYVNFASVWLGEQAGSQDNSEKAFQTLEANLSKLSKDAIAIEPSLIYLRGMVNYVQSKFELALTDFDAYFALNPASIDAAFLLAKTHVKLQNYPSALSIFSKLENLAVNNLRHGLFLGDLYLANNQVYKASELVEKLRTQYNKLPQFSLFELKVLMQRDDKSAALKHLDSIAVLYPDNQAVLYTYALTNLNLGRYGRVAQTIHALESSGANRLSIAKLKIGLKIKQANFEEAIKQIDHEIEQYKSKDDDLLFNKAVALNGLGRYSDAKKILLNLEKVSSQDESLNLNEHKLSHQLELATSYAGLQDYEAAESIYTELLSENALNESLINLFVDFLIVKGDYSKALEKVSILTRKFATTAIYVIQKARLHIKLGDFEEAEKETNKLSYLAQQQPLLYKSQSDLYKALGKTSSALKALEKLRGVYSGQRQIELDYAKLLMAVGQQTEASNVLKVLRKSFPKDDEIHLFSAELLISQGRYQEAQNTYTELLSGEPLNQVVLAKMYALVSKGYAPESFLQAVDHAISLNDEYFFRSLRAQYHYYFGSTETAIKDYEYILDTENAPNQAALLNRLADLYFSIEPKESLRYASEAHRLEPDNPRILETLAWAHVKQGEYSKALGLLREASVVNSLSPRLQYRLALVLQKLSRKAEAIDILENVLESNEANFTHKQDILILLAELKSNKT
ncbi:tetratricopeptide repeat protein [Agaribacter flavus]|uniref:Tetratricopeptide repeat protein n=1 Tax=Agaribacter flavus TaxID=1902781 RepID=A0ABV7FUC4_9ALTE